MTPSRRLAPLPPAFGQLPPYEEKQVAPYEEKAETATTSGSANSTSPPLSPSQVIIVVDLRLGGEEFSSTLNLKIKLYVGLIY